MCFAEKCCFFLRLDLGCVILGIFSIVSNIFFLASSITLLSSDMSNHQGFSVFSEEFNNVSIYTILIIISIMAVLGIVAAVALIIGVKKHRPDLILYYFSYGIMLIILAQLGALLELLHGYWICALIQFIASLLYIHFIVVVHTTYDLILRGKRFGSNEHLIKENETIA